MRCYRQSRTICIPSVGAPEGTDGSDCPCQPPLVPPHRVHSPGPYVSPLGTSVSAPGTTQQGWSPAPGPGAVLSQAFSPSWPRPVPVPGRCPVLGSGFALGVLSCPAAGWDSGIGRAARPCPALLPHGDGSLQGSGRDPWHSHLRCCLRHLGWVYAEQRFCDFPSQRHSCKVTRVL